MATTAESWSIFIFGDLGGYAVFAHRGETCFGRALQGAHVCALQLAAFISNIFIGFSADLIDIRREMEARWTREGRIQIIECLVFRRRKIHLNSGKEMRR